MTDTPLPETKVYTVTIDADSRGRIAPGVQEAVEDALTKMLGEGDELDDFLTEYGVIVLDGCTDAFAARVSQLPGVASVELDMDATLERAADEAYEPPPPPKDQYDDQALFHAIRKNDIARVDKILAAGVDVNACNGFAIVIAASEGLPEMAQHLLDKGANINARNGAAFRSAKTEPVRFVLEHHKAAGKHGGKPPAP